MYHIAAKQKFLGIVDNAPDEHTAGARAIEEYQVPVNERGRLMARQADLPLARSLVWNIPTIGILMNVAGALL